MSTRERELARMRSERAAYRRRVARERQLHNLRITLVAGVASVVFVFAVAYLMRGHGCY